jgi:hypothetical protein
VKEKAPRFFFFPGKGWGEEGTPLSSSRAEFRDPTSRYTGVRSLGQGFECLVTPELAPVAARAAMPKIYPQDQSLKGLPGVLFCDFVNRVQIWIFRHSEDPGCFKFGARHWPRLGKSGIDSEIQRQFMVSFG